MNLRQRIENHNISIIEPKRTERRIAKKWKALTKYTKDGNYGTDTCNQPDILGDALEIIETKLHK